MEYYAHKREMPDGAVRWQTVREHLEGTAERAASCLRSCGLSQAAYLAGLLHDMGKLTEEFQSYLIRGDRSQRGSVIHTFQGCRFLMERYHETENMTERIAAELLAYAVGAHHGLFDCVDETKKIGLRYRVEKENTNYDEARSAFLSQNIRAQELNRRFTLAAEEIGTVLTKIDETYQSDEEYSFEIGMLARLLLSAVIEGDRYDTAAFLTGVEAPQWPENMTPIWEDRLRYVEEKLAQFQEDSPVAKARAEISRQCREFAAQPPGIYRLNVPTGGGKTLASLRYALAHAARYNRRRIIFTSPLLSILEQNASVIHEFVGDDSLILEHHSNLVQTDRTKDELDERELLLQGWGAPILITTMVQLLNTLFDGRTSSVRRFQALCGSVIVIDEVQTVPSKLITLFNLAMRFLSEQCGATVVLCSATQPCFDAAAHPLGQTPADIVPHDEKLWRAFERTYIEPLENTRLEQLPERIRGIMEEADSLLVVCNKKAQAAYLLAQTRSPEYASYHLSASMCMQHRRDVVEKLRASLERKEKTLCISTQVIEAGVDISFQRVLRLTAGMDSIIQSAGRCNRNGESQQPCPVYMVDCTDEKLGMLQDIQRGKAASTSLLEVYRNCPEKFGGSLESDAAITQYYINYYAEMGQGAQDTPIPQLNTSLFELLSSNPMCVDEDCTGIENYALWQAFQTAGRYFSVFDEDTTDILVPYGAGKQCIEELCTKRCEWDLQYREKVLKTANSYTVSVYSYQKKRLEEQHALYSICGGSVLVLSEDYYDETTGITTEAKQQGFLEA